jgi:hypothetical protein
MLETRTQHWRSVVAITLLVLGLLLSVMPPPAQTQGSPGSTPINLEHVRLIVASIPAHSHGAKQAQNQPGGQGMVYFYFTGHWRKMAAERCNFSGVLRVFCQAI